MRRGLGQINLYLFISFTCVIVIVAKIVHGTKNTFIYRNRTHNSIAFFVVKWFPFLIQCLYFIARSIKYEVTFVLYFSIITQQEC